MTSKKDKAEAAQMGFSDPGEPLVEQNIPIDKIKIDQSYQRKDIKAELVNYIARELVYAGLGRLTVGYRCEDDCYYCVDGQHRLLALRLRNSLGVPPRIVTVACSVFVSRGRMHEAKVFETVNIRARLGRDVMFDNSYLQGKEPHVTIMRFLDSVGVPLAKTSRTHGAISYHTVLVERWINDANASKSAILAQRVLAGGERPFNNYVHRGLWWCASHGVPVERYATKLAQMGGIPRILQSISAFSSGEHIANSDRRCGIGTLNLINRHLRNKYAVSDPILGHNALEIRRERGAVREKSGTQRELDLVQQRSGD